MKTVGFRADILYRLIKIHKEIHNELPPFCPILLAIDASTYILAKFLLQFLTHSSADEYTVTGSFHFVEEICQQDRNLDMACLGVDSSFTNIALDENLSTIFLLMTYTMATQISLTSQNMTFVICVRPFKINYLFIIICLYHNCFHFSWLFAIKWQNIKIVIFSNFLKTDLFLQHLKKTWKKNLLTHHSISVWQFFAYVFYLSAHHFKFVFSAISITHMHTLILICMALDFIYHKVCSSC